MTEYGEFWCDECRTYYPDPLEELHKESHRYYRPSRLPLPDQAVVAFLAALMVLALIVVKVQ